MDIHVGLDDADSPHGGCTTYLGYLLASYLRRKNALFLDLPYLVRLNPNVPVKTRGNGAVSLHLRLDGGDLCDVAWELASVIEHEVETHGKTSPGLVVASGRAVGMLSRVYERALSEYVPLAYVRELLEELARRGEVCLTSLRGRGLTGSAAAIGAFKLREFTYEVLVYGPRELGARLVSSDEVFKEVDRRYRPYIFATYDYVEKRTLATPRSGAPVVLGLRGLSPRLLVETLSIIPGASRWILYKTNQATFAHLRTKKNISSLKPYDSALVEGRVKGSPRILKGGHIKVTLCDHTGCIDVMFYRETGYLRHVARLLRSGDLVEVGGGVVPRFGFTLNAESLRVISTSPEALELNPLCPVCGRRMKSAGRGKGFKCLGCGFKSLDLEKVRVEHARHLEPGLYLPSPRAYRHLTKPREVLGLSSEEEIPEEWIR